MKLKHLKNPFILAYISTNIIACNMGTTTLQDISNTSSKKPSLKYESLEHYNLSSKLQLVFFDSNKVPFQQSASTIVKKVILSDGNTYDISFAQMIYLAGDYIAEPDLNISGSKDNIDNHYSIDIIRANFLKNFNEFDEYYQGSYSGATKNKVADFIPKIQEIIDEQIQRNQNNIINGRPLSNLDDSDLKLNCATGGLCENQVDLLKSQGLYMRVSSKGGDHFGRYALENYLIAHRVALETAATAKNNDDLLLAYAYEAYGDHYLTDLFSSGHERTPIVELMNLSDEEELNLLFNNKLLANMLQKNGITKQYILLSLAKFMHDQDNESGLFITDLGNSSGVGWSAYGDKYLFVNNNSKNVTKIQEALQNGVNQIAGVYQNREQITQIDKLLMEMKTFLPDLEYINNTSKNPAPKFAIINGLLYEPGYRDWANGSSGVICALKRNINKIIEDKNILTPIENILNNYCYDSINGFAYAYDNSLSNSYLDETFSSKEKNIATININNKYHIHINTNTEQGFTTPIIEAKDGTHCEFKYPIRYKRYGTYTSLDEQSGNSILHDSPIIGSEYLICYGGNTNKYSILYKASALNYNQYMGFTNTHNTSVNIKLCTDNDGVIYLTNTHNNCNEWR